MSKYPAAHFLTSVADATRLIADDGAEVAFVGRSNAGKSTAINAIVGMRDLARTSKTPGRTQLINFFELRPGARLVDLPGYGYAKVSKAMRNQWAELIEDYFRERRSLTGVIVIVDARRGLQDSDREMLAWAAAGGRAAHVLLTKADKLSRIEADSALAAAQDELGNHTSVQLFSGARGIGVDAARQQLEALLACGTAEEIAGRGH